MWSPVSLLFCLCLATIAVAEGNQRADCYQGIFADIGNPCQLHGPVVYPHPRDSTKFLKCELGRVYIYQCPVGEEYNEDTMTCLSSQPVTAPPHTQSSIHCPIQQTPTSMAIYFAVAGDNTKFIECGPEGSINTLTCPSSLVWDEVRLSCVYRFSLGTQGQPSQDTLQPNSGIKNPCVGHVITNPNGEFYPHPDSTKFIQCDLAGDAYVVQCPPRLVWNSYNTSCDFPFKHG